MDSLTQIVLGAAVGEACLGKKIGNRAMLWGGIAGTIPDLDVLGVGFLSPIQTITVHRGYSHSIVFAVFFSFLMAYIVNRYYASGWYRNPSMRKVSSILGALITIAFFGGLAAAFFVLQLPLTFCLIISLGFLVFAGIVIRNLIQQYGLTSTVFDIDVSYKEWYWFFFWTIITHPILDSFTTYGTQLFLPFSDYRVGINNISVADPLYTVPFGILLILAAFAKRGSKQRTKLAWWSIGISSAYMIFTLVNKSYINSIVEKTIAEEKIAAIRFTTSPTILNNILWSATIESDSSYYTGQYSWFDKVKKFKLTEVRKDHGLLGRAAQACYETERLQWFSNGYFNVIKRRDGLLQLNDLRFGLFDPTKPADDEGNYIFRFTLDKGEDGCLIVVKEEGGPPRGKEQEMFPRLWKRIKGE